MMWRLTTCFALVSLVGTVFIPEGHTQTSTFSVDGYVKNLSLDPVAGVTVSIAHPTAGRSRPKTTDSDGYFLFTGLRPMSDPYYLEVYWGRTLICRESIVVNDNIRWRDVIINQ
jgi:Carboxypeptidase regulatory-like domain